MRSPPSMARPPFNRKVVLAQQKRRQLQGGTSGHGEARPSGAIQVSWEIARPQNLWSARGALRNSGARCCQSIGT
eukprot:1312834-Alexandrium_andersonii.AAC.1